MSPLSRDSRILVIAAHPDDEVLGAGATIARFVNEGAQVSSLIMGRGVASRFRESESEKRISETRDLGDMVQQAHRILGDRLLPLGDFPDNQMDCVPLLDIVRFAEEAIAEVRPTCVLTHGPADVNIDHRLVHEAVLAAARSLPGSSVELLAFFPILSSSEWRPPGALSFQPTLYVDVTEYVQVKLKALASYSTEMRPPPHPRSLEAANAQLRLWGSAIGVDAAETFQVGRWLA